MENSLLDGFYFMREPDALEINPYVFDRVKLLGYDEETAWFNIAASNAALADCEFQINENQIISAKSAALSSSYYTDKRDIYKTTIDRLIANNAPIDGIGFQNRYKWEHIDPAITYDRLNDFSTAYPNLDLVGTEFEIKDQDPFFPTEEVRAQMTEETLTTYFSHPNATGLNVWTYMKNDSRSFCSVQPYQPHSRWRRR